MENNQLLELKLQLHQQCLAVIQQRMENAQQVIRSAEEGAGEETKSSAGDKYETGREMMQQEKNRAINQLNEANKLVVALQRIGTGHTETVSEGSVVKTDKGNFYIAVGAGTLSCNNENYFAVSAMSPIGVKMMRLRAGGGFEMNGQHYTIKQVF